MRVPSWRGGHSIRSAQHGTKGLDANLIFDLGLHIGQDTEFYLKKGFRVIAVEANPVLAAAAAEKFHSQISNGQLVIENVGIGPTEGRMPFYVNESLSEWSSFIESLGSRAGKFHAVDVAAVRLETLFKKHGVPYYLKIDIEGYDFYAIKSLWALPEKPSYVSFEAVPNSLDGAATLFAMGYHEFKFINQLTVPSCRLPNPAREGAYVEHEFSLGSTGPFGEETPYEWGSLAEVAVDYIKFFKLEFVDRRIPQGWCDFHCKRER